jgi:hypothetical protein
MEVLGNWQNHGATTLPGAVVFRGDGIQTVGGTALTRFGTLEVNKPSGALSLERAAVVTNTLTMSAGTLATNTYELTTTGATLRESPESYVLGTTLSTAQLTTAGMSYDFGDLGLVLTPRGPILPGATTVRRLTGTSLTGQGTGSTVLRSYNIEAATNSGLDVVLQFGYFDSELNGLPEEGLTLFRSATGPAGPWEAVASVSQNTTANTVTASGVEHFSIWTLSQRTNPLPVELARFTAEAKGRDALLRWTTAQEKDNAAFLIESSVDGRRFHEIGRQTGQGTRTQATAYQFLDRDLMRYDAPVIYYRLRQVDTDGRETVLPVRVVRVVQAAPEFRVYPTVVADGHLRYHYEGTFSADVTLAVYNTTGQLLLRQQGPALRSGEVLLPGLPTGWYVVHLTTQGKHYTERFYRP